MDKELALDAIKILSALESRLYERNDRLPDYLHEQLARLVEKLTVEVLK